MPENVKAALMTDPFGKVLIAIAIALLLWFGQTVQQNTLALARQSAEIQSLRESLVRSGEDRYTGTQARSDLALLAQRLDRIEAYQNDLRPRIRALESFIRQAPTP